MAKETTWQKRCKNLLGHYLDAQTGEIFDSEFKEHVDYLREHKPFLDEAGYPADMYPSNLTIFMRHFDLPLAIKAVIRDYILSNRVDTNLSKPSLAFVDERDGTHRLDIDSVDEEYWDNYSEHNSEIMLVIPNEYTTKTEIKEFIDNNYDFLEAKQIKEKKPARIRPRLNAKRDNKLTDLYAQGKSYGEIAKQVRQENWDGVALGHAEIGIAINRHRKSK